MIARHFSEKLCRGALLVSLLTLAPACIEPLPEKVSLTSSGEQVELVTDTPNTDVYVEIGEVVGRAIGTEKGDAFTAARNAARNATATKNGTILRVDSVTAQLEWQSRETIVTVTGTAYRIK